jgi:hypothetical protein
VGRKRDLFVLVAFVIAPHAGFAQGVNANADALFHQGRDLMAAGKYAEACSAFEASEQADPAVTTLLNLADCREKNSQLATAWALFLDAERQTRDSKDASTQRYHDTALEHAKKLEPTLSKLAIDVGDHVAGLTITRAGQPVDVELWNRSLPIDGGTYTISATAPGFESWQTTVEVAASGDTKTVEVPRLERELAHTTHALPPKMPAAAPRAPAPHARMRVAGLALIGVGGASTIAGVVVGALARSKWNDAKAVCGASLECDNGADFSRAHSLASAAHLRGNIATGLVAGGLVGVAAGIALRWVGRDRVAIEPVIDASNVGVAVHARF